MLQYFETLSDDSGNALPGATVTVTAYPGGGATTIYSTNGTASPIANSKVTADVTGQVSFYVPDGAYILTYIYNGTTYKVKQPVQMLDPMGFVAATDTGVVNAYVVTGSQYPVSLYTNLKLTVQIGVTNTGASTLNLNSTGNQPIQQAGGSALPANALLAGGVYTFQWTGSAWQLLLDLITTGIIGGLLYPQTAGEIAASVTPVNFIYPCGNAWRYLNATQLADVQGYTYLQDCTTALQNCINAAYKSNVNAYFPGGGYLISSTLLVNVIDQTNYRNKGFRVYGDGAGPVFVQPGVAGVGTTVLQGNGNFTMFRYDQYLGSVTTSGNYYVDGIRFQQISSACTAAVVQLDVLGEYSIFEKNEIIQAGTGDGLRLLELTKGIIRHCNILNRDWNTSGLGAARVGAGINVFAQYNAGLGTIYKCTSRGFKDAYVLGAVSTGGILLSALSISECECSVNYRGITLTNNTTKCEVFHNYFEAMELTNIIDQGSYSVVRDNFIQGGPSTIWTTGIDASGNGGGCVYDGNEIGLPAALSGVTGMVVGASSTIPVTVTNNQFVWGSSGTGLSNVIGLQLSGANAMINHAGNMFAPNAGWAGATNCTQFADLTTSSSGSSGDGVIGFGMAADANTSFPRMARGALGLWQNTTALGNSAVSGGVLTLGAASDYTLTFSSLQTVTSINPAVCEEGHIYVLHITNVNCTLTANANIKLNGSANFTPGANGATITFRMKVNVAYEIARAAY
jgi:hypothetical protein